MAKIYATNPTTVRYTAEGPPIPAHPYLLSHRGGHPEPLWVNFELCRHLAGTEAPYFANVYGKYS
jgi:hypothetical protein